MRETGYWWPPLTVDNGHMIGRNSSCSCFLALTAIKILRHDFFLESLLVEDSKGKTIGHPADDIIEFLDLRIVQDAV